MGKIIQILLLLAAAQDVEIKAFYTTARHVDIKVLEVI
jgi:hypothetical protein